MTNEENCEWTAEIIDDSLKSLFIAQEAYANGNPGSALIRLGIQKTQRIPEMKKKAGVSADIINDPELAKDIDTVIKMIQSRKPSKEVKGAVMEIDKRWALDGYRAYCACMSKD